MDPVAQKLDSYPWPYADQDPQAVEIIAERVATTGRQQRLLSYSDLVRGITFHISTVNKGQPFQITPSDWSELHRAMVGDFLGCLCVETYRRGQFMGSALVVSRDTKQPGHGFRDFMHELGLLVSKQELEFLTLWTTEVQKAYAWYSSNQW